MYIESISWISLIILAITIVIEFSRDKKNRGEIFRDVVFCLIILWILIGFGLYILSMR